MDGLKIFKAVLHTGGKTEEWIKEHYGNFVPTQEDVEAAKKYYDAWDGHKCLVMLDDSDPEVYMYSGPLTEDDVPQAKEATYLMEQDDMFGQYINQREEFDRDYDNGDYFPAGAIVFTKGDVEIVA